jgi:16S rRNA (adenine1518-N6/adenine1519-N6)-dimethyltransferase
LATNSEPCKALLGRYGITPKRSLGQNFLADRGLCERVADVCCHGEAASTSQPRVLAPAPSVLEIGAGVGALTGPLLARGCRVLAIETDRRLTPVLREEFQTFLTTGALEILEADVREVDLDAQLKSLPGPRVLAGNLPYHLSGLLLRRAADLAPLVLRSVFLLQQEVVERLCAAAGADDYGALSVFTAATYRAERAFIVRRGAFYPQPNVDSAVACLTPLGAQAVDTAGLFAELVHRAFGQRRKTLRNAWRELACRKANGRQWRRLPASTWAPVVRRCRSRISRGLQAHCAALGCSPTPRAKPLNHRSSRTCRGRVVRRE